MNLIKCPKCKGQNFRNADTETIVCEDQPSFFYCDDCKIFFDKDIGILS